MPEHDAMMHARYNSFVLHWFTSIHTIVYYSFHLNAALTLLLCPERVKLLCADVRTFQDDTEHGGITFRMTMTRARQEGPGTMG